MSSTVEMEALMSVELMWKRGREEGRGVWKEG